MLNLAWLVYSGWGRVMLYFTIGLGLVAISTLS